MRSGAIRGPVEAPCYHGLPLYWLPADDRRRLFLGHALPQQRLQNHVRRSCHRWASRSDTSVFLCILHESVVHASGRNGWIRQCALNNDGRRTSFQSIHRDLHGREIAMGGDTCPPQLPKIPIGARCTRIVGGICAARFLTATDRGLESRTAHPDLCRSFRCSRIVIIAVQADSVSTRR